VSYDLYITPKQFDFQAMFDWLGWREHYEQGGSQVRYSNEDTGVYFSFDFYDEPAQEEGEPPRKPYIAFNLNYNRPHIFGLEAEPEVAAFLGQFESTIDDPQMEGMGDGPYSREGFLRSWNAGNRFGFRAAGSSSKPPPPWPADPALIEAIWKWNHGRKALQKTAGDQVFVPRITWFLPEGASDPVPAVNWTDRVPTMIPETLVTHVALVRQPKQTLMDRLGLTSARPKFEFRLAGVKGLAHMPGMDRGEAHGHPVFYTPLVQTTDMQKLFTGAWPPNSATFLATELVCGADLVALMGRP
jgi:hypothetical protein